MSEPTIFSLTAKALDAVKAAGEFEPKSVIGDVFVEIEKSFMADYEFLRRSMGQGFVNQRIGKEVKRRLGYLNDKKRNHNPESGLITGFQILRKDRGASKPVKKT